MREGSYWFYDTPHTRRMDVLSLRRVTGRITGVAPGAPQGLCCMSRADRTVARRDPADERVALAAPPESFALANGCALGRRRGDCRPGSGGRDKHSGDEARGETIARGDAG